MSDLANFSSENELRTWLDEQPPTTHRKLAALGALRVLPFALERIPEELLDESSQTLDLEFDNRSLAVFWASLCMTVAAWNDSAKFKQAAQLSQKKLRSFERTEEPVLSSAASARSQLKFAAVVNSSSIGDDQRSAKFAAFSLLRSWDLRRQNSEVNELEDFRTDAELLHDICQFLKPNVEHRLKLFNATAKTKRLLSIWPGFFDHLGPHALHWSFWREWYQGFLDGKPLDWEIQRRVALIHDEIWEQVAEEIERIRTLFDLEQEIQQLKAQLPSVQSTTQPPQIGDNGGPPLDDALVQKAQTDLRALWAHVEELEDEISQPEPSPSRIAEIAQTLWDLSTKIAAYCGSVADDMIREGAKELAKAGAKWAARGITVSAVAQTDGVQSVAKAAWAFAKALGGG